jgi:predicted DNA-binding ribbon-helix-helix protein
MTKGLTLNLDSFSRQVLERLAGGTGGSPSRAVRISCIYYLSERHSERLAWRVPRLAPAGTGEYRVNVKLEGALWSALAKEAAEQDVSTEDLAIHAVLYFVADVDSGRQIGLLERAIRDADA